MISGKNVSRADLPSERFHKKGGRRMKNRIICVFLCLFLFLSCFTPTVLAADQSYIVTAEAGTYLYYLASASSAKLALVPKGAVLTAGEGSGTFVKTSYAGYSGWVLADDLTLSADPDLWGILIETPPDKTTYFEDEEFVSDGLTVTAVYNDGRRAPAKGFSVAAPDMGSAGKKNIFVSWGGKTASFKIEVLRLPVERIEVTALPDNTKIVEDSDTYDFTGLEVTAYYTDGRAPQVVTGYTLSGIDPHIIGKQSVNINYKYEGIDASFEVEVVPKKAVNLRLTRIPDKTVYYENDLTPDITGIGLTVDYDNGKSENVRPDKAVFRQPISTEYKNTIVVYYSHFTVEYHVDVFAEEPVSLELDLPVNTRFVIGTKPDPDALLGLRVYKIFNSGRKEETTDYVVDEIDTSVFGARTINVYCGDLSASFTVNIVSDAVPGDVNKDGKVNSKDARLALRCASRLIRFTDEQLSAGDVNGDGKITTADARIILRHASHIEPIPGAEEA